MNWNTSTAKYMPTYGNETSLSKSILTSGQVTGEIDLSKLWPVDQREHDLGAVFNGIAYNPETGHFYVTGKYCPNIFEIKLIR